MAYNWRDKALAGKGLRIGVDKAKDGGWTVVKYGVNIMPEKLRGMKFETMIVDDMAQCIAGEDFRPGQMVQLREHGNKNWDVEYMRLRERESKMGLPHGTLGMPNIPAPRLEAIPLPQDFVGFMNHSTLDPSVTSNEGVLTLEKLNEFCALVFGQSYQREKPLPTIDLMNALTKLFLPENTRTLLEAGYVDTNMTLTPKGRDALNAITLLTNMEALVQSARETIAEDKKAKE